MAGRARGIFGSVGEFVGVGLSCGNGGIFGSVGELLGVEGVADCEKSKGFCLFIVGTLSIIAAARRESHGPHCQRM